MFAAQLGRKSLSNVSIEARVERLESWKRFQADKKIVENALRRLSSAIIKSVKKIVIFYDGEECLNFFDYDDSQGGWKMDGHAIKRWGRIYLRGSYFKERSKQDSYELIWHETAHLHDNRSFRKIWREISGTDYVYNWNGRKMRWVLDRNKWHKMKDQFLSGNFYGGFVTEYGSHNAEEDIAEFVMEVYAFENDFKSVFDNPQHLKSDARYQQKLLLLKKFGFIRNSTYQQIIRLLTSPTQ